MLPLPPDFDENMILNVVTAKQGPAKVSIVYFNIELNVVDSNMSEAHKHPYI
jgi:hypothetical protein